MSLSRSPGSTMTATPPRSVNLMALPARLSSTWRKRAASPTIRSRQPLVDEGGDLDVFGLRARRQQFDGFLDQRRKRERPRLQFELAGLDLGEIENLLDQRQQRFARGLRRLGVGELLGRERRVEQQIGHAENAVERRADFVADGGEEARLGAVGGFPPGRAPSPARSPRPRAVPNCRRTIPRCALPARALFPCGVRWRISMKAMTAQAAANSAPTPVA